MDTTVNMWQTLGSNAMANANPCDLMDQGNVTITPKTGFLWKLGGNQYYGLYFPNGADIAHNSGFVSATAAQPIEIWDSTSGRGKQALSNAIHGLPIMLICDNAASGLTFDSSGSSVAGVDVKSYLSGSTSSATPLPAQQQQTTQSPLKEVLKPGRNTAAAKIIGIGNWDFIPDLLAE